ncbi:hypothetical protein CMI46_03270 [Candidatus Pacearchaeota archaeon]|jgi:hypothetical protein|nr:hypothetical protein [Candidatus Pacearchaeota archaeon]
MDANQWSSESDRTKLGISTPPMQDQLQSIQARIRQGAQAVELGFIGTGKGSAGQGSFTPGTVGVPERQAIRDVAKVNDVTISSVHASMKIQGLAGFDGQQGFNENKRSRDMEEVKRTIDFAGDVTDGGAIVVHTGEFPYSVQEQHGKTPFKTKDGKSIKFSEGYATAQRAPKYLVNTKTGKIIDSIAHDFEVQYLAEKEGADKLEFETKKKTYDDFVVTAKANLDSNERKAENMKEFEKHNEGKELSDEEYKNTYGDPGWMAAHFQIDQGITQNKSDYLHHKARYDHYKHDLDQAELQLRAAEALYKGAGVAKPDFAGKQSIDALQRKVYYFKSHAEAESEYMKRYDLQRKNSYEQLYSFRPIESYGVQKTAESIAELAIDAARVTRDKKLKNPLFVAPENLWDGNYGAHPKDLRKIIVDSRNKVVEFMTSDKIEIHGKEVDNPFKSYAKKALGHTPSKSEAKKIAENHIKATFDIGHANIWRKYFDGDEKEFKSWMGHEVEKLTKDGIIGHVHVSDNFGYNDEHLPPGYGNAPIKEFLTHMNKSGFDKEFIVEPAHHDIGALHSGMEFLRTPIYRIDTQTHRWTSPERSYFGQTHIPGFVTPGYLPNVGEQKPMVWSELPLE